MIFVPQHRRAAARPARHDRDRRHDPRLLRDGYGCVRRRELDDVGKLTFGAVGAPKKIVSLLVCRRRRVDSLHQGRNASPSRRCAAGRVDGDDVRRHRSRAAMVCWRGRHAVAEITASRRTKNGYKLSKLPPEGPLRITTGRRRLHRVVEVEHQRHGLAHDAKNDPKEHVAQPVGGQSTM